VKLLLSASSKILRNIKIYLHKPLKWERSIQYKNIGRAIGAFERTLLTPSRFDDFLKGKEDALSENEKRGLQKFIHMDCTTCHNGVAIGGNSYKKIGVVEPYETKDMGRSEVTNIESDKKAFKVPSLRNITKQHPIFMMVQSRH